MIAKVEEMSAPFISKSIYKTYNPLLSILLGTEIKIPFLAYDNRGRDPAWLSVCCWEKTQDLTLAPVMSK